MKRKKGLSSFIFLLLCAAAVFIIGWMQLYVPVEKYGVLVSKTSGVDPEIIQQGGFTWRWQRIFPTNCEIHIFEAKPEKNRISLSGQLPSSDIYRALIEGRPDFSYSFTFEIEASVKPESLPDIVRKNRVASDDDLSELLKKASEEAAENAVRFILEELSDTQDSLVSFMNDEQALLSKIKGSSTFKDVNITGIRTVSSKLPDVRLYNTAKTVYEAYLEGVKNAILETTEEQVELASDDFLLIERFGKLGQVLTEYPILIDYLVVTRDDPDGALGLLDSLRKSE